MTSTARKIRRIALIGAAAGAAVGAGLRSRSRSRRPDPADGEPLGMLTGHPVTVTTDDGVQLAVETEGIAEHDVVVVFAHGWTLTRHSWHYQRKALAGRAGLVLYDQRGHGGSALPPDDGYAIERLGEDLHTVIEQVVPEGKKVVLAGHSMGGMTIMALAAAHPEVFGDRVVGAALVGTSSGGLDAISLGLRGPLGRAVPRAMDRLFAQMERGGALMEKAPRLRARMNMPVTRFLVFTRDASVTLVRFVNEMIAGTPVPVTTGFFHALGVHDKKAALPVLDEVDTVVVVGELDRLTPRVHSDVIAAGVTGARLVTVPDAAHMVALEQPARVTQELTDLLDRVARSTN
ncbi:MAG: alpha/beta fold hydrolase [Streptosporangiales bacterium]|nr:alpha/beta fold hydrolase [Streptosporangiales bacterium]